jgi:serine/threonine-protein kinase
MRITLTVTAGPHKGRTFTFSGHDTFIVGRSQRAHFRLPVKDKYFSRIHFLVEVNPPYSRLMDLGSRNGTFVNGKRVKATDLKDGYQIEAGDTIIYIAVQNEETSSSGIAKPVPTRFVPADAEAGELSSASQDDRPGTKVEVIVEATSGPPEKGSYDTLKPTTSGAPYPADQARPPPEGEVCRVCGTPTRAGLGLCLCPACQQQIRNQAQPIPNYQIVREMGRGGMGVVYLALHSSDGALVALKTIIPAVAPTKTDVERFLREARILRELAHPLIVPFLDMGEAAGQLYFVMDYVRGTDAARLLLTQDKPLPVPRAVRLVCQLLEALEYAHIKGFVHRDVKPANILVTEERGKEVVKLADFGLARVYQTSTLSGLTFKGDIGGTILFMAPEQITNFREAKPPVDQYAAGATLYNLLTNRYIYDFPPQINRRILMVLQEDPVPVRERRPEISQKLAEITHKALAREPADRFENVRTMREALLEFIK